MGTRARRAPRMVAGPAAQPPATPAARHGGAVAGRAAPGVAAPQAAPRAAADVAAAGGARRLATHRDRLGRRRLVHVPQVVLQLADLDLPVVHEGLELAVLPLAEEAGHLRAGLQRLRILEPLGDPRPLEPLGRHREVGPPVALVGVAGVLAARRVARVALQLLEALL